MQGFEQVEGLCANCAARASAGMRRSVLFLTLLFYHDNTMEQSKIMRHDEHGRRELQYCFIPTCLEGTKEVI